jgi:hypothetical protein
MGFWSFDAAECTVSYHLAGRCAALCRDLPAVGASWTITPVWMLKPPEWAVLIEAYPLIPGLVDLQH